METVRRPLLWCTGLVLLLALIPGAGAVHGSDPEAQDEPLRVMFVGDSITQGRQGDATYRYFVWKEFARQDVPVTFVGPYQDVARTGGLPSNYLHTDLGFETRHAARMSSRFAFHLVRLDQQVRTYRPDVIALMVGFNDAGRADARTIANNYTRYLEQTWAIDPEVRFVLGEVTTAHRPGRAHVAHRNRVRSAVNRRLRRRYADDSRVDIAENVTDPRRPFDPATYTYDGIHPTLAGQSLLGYHFSAAFRAGGFLPAAPARPTSPAWRVRPRIESVGVSARRARGRHSVVLRWPTQSRRIYVTGFRIVVQRGNGRIAVVRDSASAKRARVSLGRGFYRARLIALRGPMVSRPGPVTRFRVR